MGLLRICCRGTAGLLQLRAERFLGLVQAPTSCLGNDRSPHFSPPSSCNRKRASVAHEGAISPTSLLETGRKHLRFTLAIEL